MRIAEGIEKFKKLKTIINAHRSQLFFIFAAFALMVVCSYFFSGEIIEKHIALNAERLLDVGEGAVHNSLRETEVALLGLEAGIQRRLTDENPREQIAEYLLETMNRLTLSESGIRGVLNFYAYLDSLILVKSMWAPHIAPERPWGLATERMRQFVFSPPAFDKNTGITSISVLKAFYRTDNAGKRKIGIVGMDIDVTYLFRDVQTFMSKDNGYGMLLDQNFTFVVHPNENVLRQRLDKLSAEHEKVFRQLEAGQNYIPSAKLLNFSGQVVMAFFRRLENGWFFGIAIPISVYYEDLHYMSAILSILGLVFMSILSGFLLRLSAAKMRSDEENKSKSSFLARMSHEIRTPMNSILGMSELIMRHDVSKDVLEYVSVINQAGLNLLAIINDILDFSKVESGQLAVESKEYSFRRLLNDLISVARLWFADKPIVFLVNADGNIPVNLLGDDIRIRQVLTNLLSNAVKYTRDGFVSLDVRMEPLDARRIRLIFDIEDSGIGIKKEDLNKLFLDFSRLTTDYTRKVEGTGLGLVIAKTLCQLMGGEISVKSEYGRGSVFTATLIQTVARGGEKSAEKLAAVKDAEQKRLLLYEENPFCTRSILRTMRELGMKAEEAPSLEDFIGKLQGKGYDRAFVSSRYAKTCFSALEGSDMSKRLMVMIEVDEMYVLDKAENLMTPIYCVPVADALNGVVRERYENAGKFIAYFKAPAAKVLIVDDMQTNLKVAAGLMSIYGMDIHLASSAFEAFELLKNNVYDAIFMDHMMPKMDGLQATGVIREMGRGDPYYRNLPIIALTANALSGQQELFARAGMDDFLAKPIEVKKLDAILKKWIPAKKQIAASDTELQPRPQPRTAAETSMRRGELTIPGVDCAQGISLSGDSIGIYKDILSSFCDEADEATAKIGNCLAANDVKTYTILVHALKGASRSIGAMEFGELAFRLETFAREENLTEIRSGTGELLENLRVLTGNIRSALSGAANGEESET